MQPTDITLAYKNALKPGETFRFRCRQCGKCCKNREDILLNPYDLHRACSVLGISHKDFIERYCEVYVGESSRFPCVLLRPVGPEKACPLLKGNKCSMHKGKPTVCALFPLGRAMRYAAPSASGSSASPASPASSASPVEQENSGNVKNDRDGQEGGMFYFFNGATCGARDEEHTVGEWLSEFNLQESEAWFLEWSKELGEIAITIHELEKRLKPKLMEPIFGAVFTGMYLNYYAGASFMEQFRANSQKVKQMLAAIQGEIEKG